MDTRESKTPEEKKQHMMEERLPEDFAHPEPDAEQPEAKRPPRGAHWLVLGVAILVAGILLFVLLPGIIGG
ncbi:hypothetical protein OCT51_18180 [Halomonas sp. LR3S48]|uniref:hypothetical protein n=1 Tax=Halomonadaceae TaxID=28256 RepID=UPI0021E4699F|nr:hypothetical protein [Halomonas sp. LR3S48]UYG03099.1 hypothetical protein OCT51_18180 [Halomonas sp. LR3S48]